MTEQMTLGVTDKGGWGAWGFPPFLWALISICHQVKGLVYGPFLLFWAQRLYWAVLDLDLLASRCPLRSELRRQGALFLSVVGISPTTQAAAEVFVERSEGRKELLSIVCPAELKCLEFEVWSAS